MECRRIWIDLFMKKAGQRVIESAVIIIWKLIEQRNLLYNAASEICR